MKEEFGSNDEPIQEEFVQFMQYFKTTINNITIFCLQYCNAIKFKK